MTKKETTPRLTLVVPCYNEEPMLPTSARVLHDIMTRLITAQQITADSKILFVDDGSQDRTWGLITQLRHEDALFTGLKFSRNYGQEAALMAGMQVAHRYADLIITIDADLQDDPQLIFKMVAQAHAGFDIVYGVRNDRSTDTWFKRSTAEGFYWFMKKMGVELVPNHSDFRLMSRRAVAALMQFKESHPFIRGIIPQLGFPSTRLYYKRAPRQAGTSKYPLRKMIRFALDGLFSFSVAPIRAVLYAGIIICGGALAMLLWILIQHFRGMVVTGWSSIMLSLWFLGGFQLVAISIIGEYVGRSFTEAKHRPRFIIQTDTFTPAFTDTKSTVTEFHLDHQSIK
ncbi:MULTISPECIES: glycosyltransferase family 2 protein [Lactobacillaceae]|uniref:glycosyltransferase family 2 protein n=1 Tax=Lactobacillaceae TaxID=33958 RepID=UPI001456945F|nr:glycosyltransferase family 2 protein [Lactobacillus sp. HBUAS51381]NLR08381.1 glycosyltransferase family 2 protein [Lactobacillus sp. HBUAS51381]